ncbi:MAG: hypothetical protein ACRCWY_03520 [Cellulosilyticaceae bacterium]
MRKIGVYLVLIISCFLLGDTTQGETFKTVPDLKEGVSHLLVLKDDGSLWGIGSNEDKQLGVEDEWVQQLTLLMENVQAIEADAFCSYVLKKDGTLWAMGTESEPLTVQYQVDTYLSPRKLLDEVVAIEKAADIGLAIRKDGSLWGWGEKLMDGRPYKLEEGVVDVRISDNGYAYLKADGSLWLTTGLGKLRKIGKEKGALTTKQIGERVKSFDTDGNMIIFINTKNEGWFYSDHSSYIEERKGKDGVVDLEGKEYSLQQYIEMLEKEETTKVMDEVKVMNRKLILKEDGTVWEIDQVGKDTSKPLLENIETLDMYGHMPVVKTKDGTFYFLVWQNGYREMTNWREYYENWYWMKGREWLALDNVGEKIFLTQDFLMFVNEEGELWMIMDKEWAEELDFIYEPIEGVELNRIYESNYKSFVKVKMMEEFQSILK